MDYKIKQGDNYLYLNSQNGARAVVSAEQSVKLSGEDTITMKVHSAQPITFNLGDTFDCFGTTYTLNQVPSCVINAPNNLDYTLVFEGLQYRLIDKIFLMPANTKGDNIMLTLSGFMAVLLDNANRGNDGKQYVLGNCPTTEAKNLNFTDKNCLSALQMLVTEYETEYKFVETAQNIRIDIGAVGTTFAFPIKYGVGGGAYELQRTKGTDIVTRLFVYGGTQNLTYYRHDRLCLPNKARTESYIEDSDKIATYGIKEAVKNFDDIFPNRIGAVSSITGCAYNEFIDSSMNFDLNAKWGENDVEEWLALRGLEDTTANRAIYNSDIKNRATKYLMPNETAKIHFNSGSLAGYECDINKYDASTKKFTLVPLVDENGYDFPSKTHSAFKIGVNDTYVILGINLPTEYKEDAEDLLQEKAEEYYEQVSNPQYKYSLAISPLILKRMENNVERDTFKVGDYIHVIDEANNVNADIRIDSFTRDLLNPFDYKLQLSDDLVVNQQVRQLIDSKQIKTIVEKSPIADVNYLRKSYKTVEELQAMIFDTEGQIYGEKIQPLSIDTTMLKVGARSQQYTLKNVLFTPNNEGNPAKLVITAGTLEHYTIAEPDVAVWNLSAYTNNSLPTTALYVYAQCSRANSTANFLVTRTQHKFDEGSTYYYFLIGTLSSVDTQSNTRTIALTYGFSTINGQFIKTGRISSNDGQTYFDLNSGEIAGNIKFTAPEGSDNKQLIDNLIGANSSTNKYGTCATGASTTAKVVTLTQGSLSTLTSGTTISVHFTYGNTASNPTLNVSGTGAKAIKTETGSFDSTSNWGAGATIQFTYNGTNWIMSSALSANSTAQTASTKAQNALDTANGIEVGGRNLLRGTDTLTIVSSGYNWENGKFYKSGSAGNLENVTLTSTPIPSVTTGVKITITVANSNIGFAQDAVPLNKKNIVQSVWVKGNVGNKVILQPLWSGTSGEQESGSETFTISDTNWHRYTYSKMPNYGHESGVAAGYVYVWGAVGHVIYICADQIEYGNKATDWTPAPEDVDAMIAENGIEGTCTTQHNAPTMTYAVIAPYYKESYLKRGLKLKVTFTHANRQACKSLLSINGGTARNVKWGGTTNGYPIWGDNDVVEFIYDGSYWYITDEEQRIMREVYTEASNGSTNVNGGLVLTKMIQCGEGNTQAGMNGTSSSDVAFWAGGTLGQAASGDALVVIWRNGQMKLGALALDGTATGKMSMKDGNGAERFVLQNADMRLADGYRCYNNGNANNDGTKASGQTLGEIVMTTTSNSFYAIGNANTSTLGTGKLLDNCSTIARFESMDYLVEGTIYITRSSGLTTGGASFRVEIWNGSAWVTAYSKSLLYSQQPTVTDFTFPFSCVIPYTTGGTGTSYNFQSCRVVYYTNTGTASYSHFIQVSDVKYRYYQDTSKSLVQIARNGMCYWLNALNQFTVRRNNTDTAITTTIKGDVDMPGVLWAGRITNDRTRTTYLKNSGLYARNDINITSPASNTFVITHRVPNGQCSFSIVPEASEQRTYYIARNDSSGTITIYFSGTITAFDLTIYGSN